MAAVEKVRGKMSSEEADVRWGFVFRGQKDDRVLSIYIDKNGMKGVINGACVSFDSGELVKWAESTFGDLFK